MSKETKKVLPEIVINTQGKLNQALIGILTDRRLNTVLSESDAVNLVSHLSYYFSFYSKEEDKNRFDLAYLMGVAYDTNHPDYDRRRFKSAVEFLLKNSTAPHAFVLCIDPNFSIQNILATLNTLVSDTRSREKKLEFVVKGDSYRYIKVPWELFASTQRVKEIVDLEEKKKKKAEYKTAFEHFPMIKFTVNDSEGNSKTVSFLFLNFALPTAGGRSIGDRNINLVNIQEGKKTIHTYLAEADCKYTTDSFYGALERLAKNPSIHHVYLGSAANSTDRNPLHKYENGKETVYRSKYIVNEFGEQGRFYIGSRYLQDFCQLISLMKNISDAGKPVSFLTMDTRLPAFRHPSVVLSQANPASKRTYNSVEAYAVPFDETTSFFTNDMFEEYTPAANPKKGTEGGRRKTRKQKRRTTRKRRV